MNKYTGNVIGTLIISPTAIYSPKVKSEGYADAKYDLNIYDGYYHGRRLSRVVG